MTAIQASTSASFTSQPASSPSTPRQATGRQAAADTKLTPEEQSTVAQLKQTDREVRAHEMAHLGAGAGVVRGGPTYSFQRGPDGQLYAVGGEVPIDASPGRTPEETLEKARQIRAAALAPSDPSSQDMRVAAEASRMETEARDELAQAQREESGTTGRPEGLEARRNPDDAFGAGLRPQEIGVQINTFA